MIERFFVRLCGLCVALAMRFRLVKDRFVSIYQSFSSGSAPSEKRACRDSYQVWKKIIFEPSLGPLSCYQLWGSTCFLGSAMTDVAVTSIWKRHHFSVGEFVAVINTAKFVQYFRITSAIHFVRIMGIIKILL